MQRRELLRLMAGAITLPALTGLSSQRLLELGRATHARAAAASRTLGSAGDLVAALAECIMPETDTPGAAAVGVPAFIAHMVNDWMTDEQKGDFLAGLDEIERLGQASGNASFVNLPADQRHALMSRLDGTRGKPGSAESSFATVKSLTVYGYFTSEQVVTTVLKTPMIPGRYDGSAPLHSHR